MSEQGYTQPTPIQSQAIPPILAGRDLIAAAQTGTGKTAGFTLPMLQRLEASAGPQGPARHVVRALVLVPTRELAAQVEESVRTYGRHMDMRAAVIYGGVGFTPQVENLREGVDVLVATPGRLLDHVGEKTADLSRVEILVLDEADRMLDMGFIHDIRRVLALLPGERQNLLFSATFPDEVRKLAAGFMRDPLTVEVAPRNTPIESIAQIVHPVDRERKRELLAHLVKEGGWQQVLVFCRTKHGANRLAEQLVREGIEADAIHGNKSQPQRMRALKRFKASELQVLVATDIASRGLDIDALPHVVNYDLPHVPEDYVHRIGRTGRAGESGEAVTLLGGEDRTLLSAIERLTGRKIEQKIVAGFEPGPGWHTAQPEPQQQRGQQGRGQRQGQQGRGQRQGQQNRNQQGRGQPGRGQQPGNGQRRDQQPGPNSGQRQGQQPRRNPGPQGWQPQRGPGQPGRQNGKRGGKNPNAPRRDELWSDRDQQAIREQQLSYHQHRQAEEEEQE